MKINFETLRSGVISIENKDIILDRENDFTEVINGNLEIQIEKGGRIFISINGTTFIRFKPNTT